jgi:hypothetical protein
VKWRPARNAPPPSAGDLRNGLAEAEAQLRALEEERAEIHGAIVDLVGDPGRASEAQDRLAEVEALIPVRRRTIETIRQAIPAAEERQARDGFRAEVAALNARTAQLKRNLSERFNAAAEAFAAVLREMEANAEEWRQVNARAQIIGEPVGEDAERELRRDLPINRGGWSRIWADLDVPAWDGSLLFEGRPNAQRTA